MFLKLLEDFSTSDLLRAGAAEGSLRARRTNPPLESSIRRSRSADGLASAPPSLLRNDVNEARTDLFGR